MSDVREQGLEIVPEACERPQAPGDGGAAVVAARDLTRRYGRAAPPSTPCAASRSISSAAGSRRSWAPRGRASRPSCTSWPGSTSRRAASVSIDGVEITALKERQLTQLRRDKIGFIFQSFNLLPMLTAQENLVLPLTIAGRKLDDGWLDTLVTAVDLGDRLGHRPSELSGGQQQRVAIARALVSRPVVIFADEPTGNLDSKTGDEVLGLLRRSADEFGQTIVMVTHDAARRHHRRSHPLLAGRPHRARLRAHEPRRDLRHHQVARGTSERDGAGAMIRLSLRNLWSRKLRTVLTMLAIVLGVAMIAGTYVITDQINNGFHRHLREGRGRHRRQHHAQGGLLGQDLFASAGGSLPAPLLDQVRAVNGVADAAGSVERQRRASSSTASPSSTGGAPTLVFSTVAAALQPEHVHRRRGAGARRHRVDQRQARHRQAPAGRRHHRPRTTDRASSTVVISGIFDFGNSTSIGGATLVATTLADAQRWYNLQGQSRAISVAAEPGVTPDTLGRAPQGGAARLRRRQDRAAERGRQHQGRQRRHRQRAAHHPARLRRRGRDRGRLHHLQRLLDHRRPAHARVRHAALAGRDAPPGAGQRDRRGRRPGARSPRCSASPPASASPRASTRCSTPWAPTSRRRASRWRRAPSSCRSSSASAWPWSPRWRRRCGPRACRPWPRCTRAPPCRRRPSAGSPRSSRSPPSSCGGASRWRQACSSTAPTSTPAPRDGARRRAHLRRRRHGRQVRRAAAGQRHRLAGAKLAGSSGRLARENATRNPARTAATAAALMIGLAVVVFVAVFAQGFKTSFVERHRPLGQRRDRGQRAERADRSRRGARHRARRAGRRPGRRHLHGDGADQRRRARRPCTGVDPVTLRSDVALPLAEGRLRRAAGQAHGQQRRSVEEQFAAKYNLSKGKSFIALGQTGARQRFTVIGEYRDPTLHDGLHHGPERRSTSSCPRPSSDPLYIIATTERRTATQAKAAVSTAPQARSRRPTCRPRPSTPPR